MKTPLKKDATKTNVPIRSTTKEEKVESGPTTEVLTKKPIKKTKVLWKTQKKKKPERKPTARQQKAIDILDEKIGNGRKVVLAEIAREAGYSPSMVNQPKKIFGAWIVQRELKKIWVDSNGSKIAHEYLMNTRVKHVMRFAATIDPKSIIKRYTKEFPWFRCFHYQLDGDYYEFECSMPNDANVRAALEFSAKYYKIETWDSKDLRKKATEKRVDKIKLLAEKKGLHIKKPVKLWNTENSSQSQS